MPPKVIAADSDSQLAWPVAVFAHNEESRIVACLESIARGSATRPVRAYVLINGCKDRTESVVRAFAGDHPFVSPVLIPVGDKSNAWNVFVHEVAPSSEICFFVDGDVRVEAGAFDRLFETLERAPDASAAAAIPSTGRSRRFQEDLVCRHRLVLGNLYALRGEFVRRARETGTRLPVGYIGDDGLVTSLAKWDLNPAGAFVETRVEPCPAARFAFDSFSVWSLRDWRTYWRRRIRYSVRHFQHELLAPLLKGRGIDAMPRTVADLYDAQAELLARCRPRGGIDAVFDRRAISLMRLQSAAT